MAAKATASKPLSAQQNASNFSKRNRTIALVVVSLGFVMDLLDSTITNIAIPSIRQNLGASYSAIQWVVAGYALSFALLLVTGGRMGDVYGYKKLFIIGMAGFTVASLLSGESQGPGMLIAARLLQGAMAALMVPQVLSLMQVMYAPEERSAINGLFGGLGGLAATLGPIIGGLLIKANLFNQDWRPIFLINVPVGIFGLIAAVKYLPNGKSEHPLKLDVVGTGILIVAMTLLIFPLIQGRELGWPLWSYLMMVASIPVFIIFAWWQKKKDALDGSPLILPSLFEKFSFSVGLAINLVFEMVLAGFFLTFGLLMQVGLGFSPLHAALTGIPLAVGIAFTMATLAEKVIPKLGRYALSIGTIVIGIGLFLLAIIVRHYGMSTHSWQFIPSLLCVGVGMGFVFASLFAAVLNGVDPKNAGSASGTLNAIQQVGGAIGVAIVGVVFFGQLNHAAPASFASVEPALRSSLSAQHVPAQAQTAIIAGTKACFVDRSREKDSAVVPASCKQTGSDAAVSKVITAQALHANANNFTNAFRWSSVYAAILLAITLGLTFLLPARFKAQAYSEI